ncbi:hypothetical protein J2Z22_004650 [Paenibacillus forsythiae]|uniref:S-layer homology domain-containing protein n=2 Tax=Paenibacillus forsythiae TaxID=365616 RepID=A0ABU3HE09_9BACL|nr:S-layer homology domain-containing protein [Paenibacillus forsythiae]MDT3429051.1 hypothetical protein [Paenibacillus forsythiae]
MKREELQMASGLKFAASIRRLRRLCMFAVLALAVGFSWMTDIRPVEALNGQGGKSFHFLGYKYLNPTHIQVWFDKNLPQVNANPEQFAIYEGLNASGKRLPVLYLASSAEKNHNISGMPVGSSYILEVSGENSFVAGKTYTVVLDNHLTANNKVSLGAYSSNRDVVFQFAVPAAGGSYPASVEPQAQYWLADGASGVPVEGTLWFSLSLPAAHPEKVLAGISLLEKGKKLPFDRSIDAAPESGARSYAPQATLDGTFFFLPLTGSGGSAPYDLAFDTEYELTIPEMEAINGKIIKGTSIRFRTAKEDVPPPMSAIIEGHFQAGQASLSWSPLAYAAGYNLYASEDPYWGYQKVNDQPVADTAYNISLPSPGQVRYYRIAGVNAAGEGGISDCIAVSLPKEAVDGAPSFSVGLPSGSSSAAIPGRLVQPGPDGILRMDPSAASEAVKDPAQTALVADVSAYPEADGAGKAIRLSVNVLSALKQAGKPFKLTDGVLELTVSPASMTEQAAMTIGMRTPNGQALPKALKNTVSRKLFSLYALSGETYLYDIKEPVRVAVAIPQGTSDSSKLGAYVLNADTGKWEYSGGRIKDGKLVFDTTRYSSVMLAESVVSFADMKGHWARKQVEVMAARQVVAGMPSGLFQPELPVSRAQFAAMLVRALGLREASGAGSGGFADVDRRAWYASVVQAASAAGIVQGAGGKFRPEAGITRQELAVMLARALELQDAVAAVSNGGSSPLFSDAGQIDGWAIDSVAKIYRLGIVKGDASGAFRARSQATRAEAAVMLNALMDKLPQE